MGEGRGISRIREWQGKGGREGETMRRMDRYTHSHMHSLTHSLTNSLSYLLAAVDVVLPPDVALPGSAHAEVDGVPAKHPSLSLTRSLVLSPACCHRCCSS